MTIDKGQVNTRERALSSDWNRQTELGNRAISEALSAAVSGYSRESGVLGENSFLCTPQNGTMKTAIAPGIALFYDVTKVYPLSQMVWCESRELREVTHEPADGLARWDVIEMRPGQQVSSTQPRDQFDPLTGTFTVVNMVKEIQSWPEFQIRKGTPSASPSIPVGVAGWMPLAYVRVNGGAVAVVQTEVVYCRPLLGTRQIDREGWTTSPVNGVYATDVTGGGVNTNGGNLIGFLAKTMEGRFGRHHHRFRLTASATLRVTSMTWDGGGLPLGDTPVYFYLIPPPYPAGYMSALAPRELWTPDIVNLYNNNGGFYSASLQSGCLIVSSTTPPGLTHPSGAPAGTGAFNLTFFSAGGSLSLRSDWVYIGATVYSHADVELLQQVCSGNTVATKRKPGKSFLGDVPIVAPGILYNMWSGGGPDYVGWPVTARDMDISLAVRVDPASNFKIHMTDTFGDETLTAGTYINQFSNNDAAEQTFGAIIPVEADSTGNVRIYTASSTGLGIVAQLISKCYRDEILKQR